MHNTFNSAVFLSKHGTDPYINSLAFSANTTPVEILDYENTVGPIFMRSILKYKLMNRCKQDSRDFYYVDTGYFGNQVSQSNLAGHKVWHRIVLNNVQHTGIHYFPDDRFLKTGVTIKPWKKSGRSIVIAAPDEKPCKCYGIDLDQWVASTVSTIQQYTDRPIVVRHRTKSRQDRVISNTFAEAIEDAFAVVTYNSAAGIEAVLQGVPVFTLAPVHAAAAVASQDLTKIETPFYPEFVREWACYLAYCQFHVSELKSGVAIKMLRDYDQIYRST